MSLNFTWGPENELKLNGNDELCCGLLSPGADPN